MKRLLFSACLFSCFVLVSCTNYGSSDDSPPMSIYGNNQDFMLQDYNLKEVTSYKNFVLADQDFSGPENITDITESAVITTTEEVVNESNTIADNTTNVGEGESATIAAANDISEYGFIFPVDMSGNPTLTSYFGHRNISNGSKNHQGLDIGCTKNTNIYAAADGTITYSGYLGSAGNAIIITHGKDKKGRVVTTTYMHNTELLVSAGKKVKCGDLIAHSGNTGGNYGQHCHFQVEIGGIKYNPVRALNFESLKVVDSDKKEIINFTSKTGQYTWDEYKKNLYYDGSQYYTKEE